MDVNNFSCPECNHRIESWRTKRVEFECPGCNKRFKSNYKASLRNSAVIAAALWLIAVLIGCYYSESWPKVLAIAVDMGILATFLIALFIHRRGCRIDVV